VFVTHDQEEAMEVADDIVVMNHGRIEQVGTPGEVYEKPANEFVMGFVGQAHLIGGEWVRPHDLEIRLEPNGNTVPASVERVVSLGFEVRVLLNLEDDQSATVQLTRDEAQQLELATGDSVFVRPRASRVFAAT
jgi:sulfate transport system ATP-binding protein